MYLQQFLQLMSGLSEKVGFFSEENIDCNEVCFVVWNCDLVWNWEINSGILWGWALHFWMTCQVLLIFPYSYCWTACVIPVSLSFTLPSPLTHTRVLNPPDTRKVLQNLSCVSADEVHHLVLQAPCKSSDLDPIPTSLVKDCIDILIIPITSIINLSLTGGSFPSHFKSAHVSPLLKKPLNKESMRNYRPVSNLSFLFKVLEKVVVNQLNTHINSSNTSNQHQSAYRKFHSTETALLKIHSDILASMDAGRAHRCLRGGGEAKSKRYVLRRLLKVATEVAEQTDSERLFWREGARELKALAPLLILILGMDRVIPLFDLSEHDGREVAIKEQR